MDEIIEEAAPAPVPVPEGGGMFLTHFAVYDLQRAAKWAKFIAIVGFIICGIMAVFCCFLGPLMSFLTSFSPTPMPPGVSAVFAVMGVILFIINAVIFLINLYLYQFASRSLNAIKINDTELMERSIHRLQSFFKAVGIVVIVYLAFYILYLLIILAVIAGGGLHHAV